jgi:predicted anti-sigma-YlaC factor YlaD
MSRLAECHHEADLVAAVTSGRWPAAVDPAMREHVASCAVCAEVLQVAEAMTALEQETLADTRLPAAGQVWWRAQIRARHQALGGAAAVGLIAAVVSWKWATIATVAFDLGLIAWVGVATAAVLGPLAIYAAVREP